MSVVPAFYNKEAGTRALTTETGAGQWGSAQAMACNFFGLDLEVYMVKVSYFQKPYRRIIMENFGAVSTLTSAIAFPSIRNLTVPIGVPAFTGAMSGPA